MMRDYIRQIEYIARDVELAIKEDMMPLKGTEDDPQLDVESCEKIKQSIIESIDRIQF